MDLIEVKDVAAAVSMAHRWGTTLVSLMTLPTSKILWGSPLCLLCLRMRTRLGMR